MIISHWVDNAENSPYPPAIDRGEIIQPGASHKADQGQTDWIYPEEHKTRTIERILNQVFPQ